MFRVTTLDLQQAAARRATARSITQHDFFGQAGLPDRQRPARRRDLRLALGKVYTFGPTFRAENSNTSRHLAEFWMVEPEMAFYELDRQHGPGRGVPQAHHSRRRSNTAPRTWSSSTSASTKTVLRDARNMSSQSDFRRLPYTEAVEILKKSGKTFEFPVEWGIDLQAEHERYLTEEAFQEAGDPLRLSADDQAVLHARQRRRQNGAGDGRAGARRRRDHRRQPARGAARRAAKRMSEQGLEPEAYWWYLDLRRYGTVPHAGFGLGLERMMMFLTGMANIRDVIPFPRTPGNAEF